jgi:murein DD-endopeptidase MepM/ murein hydrolase activator NlpD
MKYLVALILVLGLGALLFPYLGRWSSSEVSVQQGIVQAAARADGVASEPSSHVPAVQPEAVTAPAADVAAPATPNAAPAAAAPRAATGASLPADTAQLLIPVQGKSAADLADTFTDARSQGRLHDAIDIMAAAGTPVLAVADGTVEKLFYSERGGITIYQFEPTGKYAYYYAHLQRYADGLAEKQAIRRGQVIGYVGSTGNASPDAPHLHFAIFLLGPEKRWWEGTAINPYPVLARK